MSNSTALNFNEEDYLEEGGVIRVDEETSSGDVKYKWNIIVDGGRPPYDVVLKDENGIILDSKWNVTSDNINGEFFASPNIENVILETVDESNQYISKTFEV